MDNGRCMSRQRAALGALLDLSSRRVLTQQEIEQEHTAAMSAARRSRDEASADAEQQHADETAAARAQHDAKLAQIESAFTNDRAAADAEYEKTRAKLADEADKNEQAALETLNQKVWLAESVCEGAINDLNKKVAELKQSAEDRLESLVELRERGVELMRGFELPVPEDWSPIDASQVDDGEVKDVGRALADGCASVEEAVSTLRKLRTPVWWKRTRWYLVGLLFLVALCGVGAAVMWQHVAYWVAGIGTGVIAIALVVVIWQRAQVRRRRAAEAFEPLVSVCRMAPTLADVGYRRAVRKAEVKQAELEQQRATNVKAARQKIEPVRAELARRREVVLKQVDEKYHAYVEHIAQKRDHDRGVVANWLTSKLTRIDAARDAATVDVQAAYDAEIEANESRRAAHGRDLESLWREGVEQAERAIEHAAALDAQTTHDWTSAAWDEFKPPHEGTPLIRFGRLNVDIADIGRGLAVDHNAYDTPARQAPVMLELPHDGSLLIATDREGRAAATGVLQSVMLRLLTALPPGRARFTIIDAVGRGESFAGFMHLADHDEKLVGKRIWTEREHIHERLADLTEHMENVIQKYLRDEYDTIDAYNAQAGELAEPYRFLVVADFPAGFNEEAAARFKSIVNSGARCGVYTLVMLDAEAELPPGLSRDDLVAHSVTIERREGVFVVKDDVLAQFDLETDAAPSPERLQGLLRRVGEAAQDFTRVEVAFDSITPGGDGLWPSDSAEVLTVPIGRCGATRLQHMTLGRGVAQHALLAGKTGSGKSTLLHVMVTNLALWYSPDEVEFYLIDFKKGVEFKTYATHDLPHARAVAIESDREFGLSVLQRMDAELRRRGDLFRACNVQDLAGYRQAKPDDAMPRTLLIIDEFQEFFSDDDKIAQDAALLLDRLVRQGRAFGIHVVLGTQTLAGAYGLARSTIGQMAVRVALQCSEADAQLILADNNSAARLLARPGEAIYNDAGGLLEGNSPFQIAWLNEKQREAKLAQVAQLARDRGVTTSAPIVFEGNAPAEVEGNTPLNDLLEADVWPTTQAGAPPVATAWLGDPIAIKAPTGATIRRQAAANALIVGQRDDAAMAMMVTSLASLASQLGPNDARFTIFDGSPADSPLHGRLASLAESLPHTTRVVPWRQSADAINDLRTELQRRQDEDDETAPAEFILLFGLQRYRALAKSEDDFSFSMSDDPTDAKPKPDKQFADLLRDGPPLGVHTILWCDSAGVLMRMLDRAALREFDARVLFQMSATDSTHLIDSPAAGKLGLHRALFFSEEQGVVERFRPYTMPGDGWMSAVGDRLSARSSPQSA